MATTQKVKIIADRKVNFQHDTARALYYDTLAKWDGKPAADLLKKWDAAPPKLPASGKPEKATGWLSFFVREGYCEIV